MLVFSCAKELPVVESESIDLNVYSISEFKDSVTIHTKLPEIKEQKSAISAIYAVNEQPKSNVFEVDGPERLKRFFNDLKLTLPKGTPKTLEVKFKLTKNYLVAYAQINNAE